MNTTENTLDSPEQKASEISKRISALEAMSGDDLKNEMRELKKALTENPAACLLLLPEDIGATVEALKRIVGNAIATASATKTKTEKPKAIKMTAKELQDALDDM